MLGSAVRFLSKRRDINYLEQDVYEPELINDSLVCAPSTSLNQIFKNARDKFMDDLAAANCDKGHRDILHIQNKDKLLFSLQKLQENQKDKGGWLHLERISLFLDKLQTYVHVMEETVVGEAVNQDSNIMTVIWGPIFLMLLWSSELREAYNSVIWAILRIAQLLPQFEDVQKVFVGKKDKIAAYLALFYRDILDFHLMTLKFFSKTSEYETDRNVILQLELIKV